LPEPTVLRDLARGRRLVVARGFASPEDEEELTAYAAALGEVMMWPFGPVLNLEERADAADGVFTPGWLPFHWDGCLSEFVPEFQVFTCVAAPPSDAGGRTVFCDTTLALANADPVTRSLWERTEVSYRIEKAAHYGGRSRSPLIVAHPDRGFATMRYQEAIPAEVPYVNRPEVTFHGLDAAQIVTVKRSLQEALYDPRQMLALSWRTGDLVIADNYTLLHGREPFTSGAPRHLRRGHVLGSPPFRNPALVREEAD